MHVAEPGSPREQVGPELLEEPLEEFEEISHPALVALLREADNLAAAVAERIKKLHEILSSSKVLRETLSRAKEIPPISTVLGGAAIDSTYPVNGGIELVGGLLLGVVAGYILFGGACKKESSCRYAAAKPFFAENDESKKKLPAYAKLLEKKVALKLFERNGRGEVDVKIILFDGELIPYILLFRSQGFIQQSPLLRKLDQAVLRILREAEEQGISLVGVVKRSYSQLFSAIHGEKLPLNDKALVSITLRAGTMIELGSFKDLLPGYARLYEKKDPERGKKLLKVIRERLRANPVYGDVKVVFYKPSIPVAYSQAVKIELLDYGGLGVDRIVGMLNKMTNPATSIPYPVDLIDEYVRFEARTLELLRRRILAKIAVHGLGTAPHIVLGYTNPEKRYLYEYPSRQERKTS